MFILIELKDCFDLFDSDKSGSISLAELEKVCDKLGFKLNNKDIKNLMNLMDKVIKVIWKNKITC